MKRRLIAPVATLFKYIQLYWYLLVINRLVFIQQAWSRWMEVGSLWPTGHFLREEMVRKGISGASEINLMILHGAGCGEFLYAIVKLVRKSGVQLNRLIVMESNPRFVLRARRLLKLLQSLGELPTRVEVVNMDALETRQHLIENGLPSADVVIGTIPYTNMPDRLEAWAQVYADTATTFVFYSYVKMFKRRSARHATDDLIAILRGKFSYVEVGWPVTLNVPPAHCILAQQTRLSEGAG
jgi:phospholipid N-methyltransferase